MIGRVIELQNLPDAQREILRLGADPAGVRIMAPKAVSRVLKIKALRPVAANIIKQEMLSFGGEAATSYGSVNQSVEATDVLLIGTYEQLRRLVNKLWLHQFGLPQLAKEIEAILNRYEAVPSPLKVGGRTLEFGGRTHIMGVLNVTPADAG
jgi:dihydropteroate synthase